MIDLKLNKKRLGMHWHYYRVRYVVFLIIALTAANFLLTATAPQTPASRKVDIYLISHYYNSDAVDAWQQELLCQLPPDQMEVNISSTPIIEGQEHTIFQMLAARMAAREGTIWIMPADMYLSFAQSGGFIALDDQIDSFTIPEGVDIASAKALVRLDDESPGQQQICGIPMDGSKGLATLFIPTGMVLAFPINTENFENAKAVANHLLSRTETLVEDSVTLNTGFRILVASSHFNSGNALEWQQELQEKFQFTPKLGIALIPYQTGREQHVAELVRTRMAADPSGLCMVPRASFAALAAKGVLMPLDDRIGQFDLPEGTDLAAGRMTVALRGEQPEERLYGIALDGVAGLTGVLNPRGMMLVFPTQPEESLAAAVEAANVLLGKR